ncbi:hypothetical protein BTO05_00300 [Winogradskyella sp. PC-19]|uniref:response regulator n=1 Tax=unclassified Winogradskyella TaxID=2615021 RepID=UPI000B3C81E6|nr:MULTISPECIES: response regulator [unclassified Winogradskyella]ARV08154.1 hypothetical protein BTO05_00300 [Winogradskyella sp. PC-19]
MPAKLTNAFLCSICIIFISFSQNKNSKAPLLDVVATNFNAVELDSISKELLTEFRRANYNVILEKGPALLKNAIALNDSELELRMSNAIGNTFIQLEDFDNANLFFNKALKVSEKQNDTLAVVNTYINFGNTYFKTDRKKSAEYFEKGLKIDYGGKRSNLVKYILHNNLAEQYMEMKDINAAKYQLNKAISYLESKDLEQMRPSFKGAIKYIEAGINMLENDTELAITNTLKSLEYKEYLDETYRLGNYKRLLKAYELTGDFINAVNTYRVYDSLTNIKYEKDKIKQLQIARIEMSMDKMKQDLIESELKNELVLQKANRDRIYLISLVVFSMFLVLAFVFLIWLRKKREKLLIGLKIKNKQYLKAKEKSEKLAKSNTRFLSTISHELRTPLYGIIGLSSSFLNNPKLNDFKDDFNSLKFSADYLLSLVNDVLNINKFSSANGKELNNLNFDLKQLLDNVVESFSFLNEKHNNKVSVNIDSRISNVIYGDKNKLLQILFNLTSNASKFTEDGSIVISVTHKENFNDKLNLNFEVKDTGRGIHPDDQRTVFDEFSQAKDSIDDDIVGTGLGLTIVNKILKVFGTELQMHSVYNEGTTFSFNIELAVGDEKKLYKSKVIKDIEYLKGKNILIVDDNKINRLVTRKLLDQHGMIYASAKNGKEAVSLAKNNTFDYILMDINMPVMNGIEASKLIRKFDTTTPIIALTATDFLDPKKEILCHGIDAIIVKPYTTEALISKFLYLEKNKEN